MLSNNGETDGMIIKYDDEGKVEWAKGIGGDGWDYIYSVVINKRWRIYSRRLF